MAHLIRKYQFPPDHDMMKPPTLVDPLSTSWYKDTINRKSGTDIKINNYTGHTFTGTDVISAKIRDSISAKNNREVANRYSQYVAKNYSDNNFDVSKYLKPNSSTSNGPKVDLYGATDFKNSPSISNGETTTFPSRINDYKSGTLPEFAMSNYSSTYSSTFGIPPKDLKYTDTVKSRYEAPRQSIVPLKTSTISSSSVPRYDRSDYISSSIPKGPSHGSDEYYMRKLGEILNVHSGPLFTSNPSMITDYLYVGGYRDAENWQYLRRLGITHVLNMAALRKSTYNPYPAQSGVVGYEAFDADDHEMYNVMQHFPKAKAFIDRARWSGGKVLVHCAMGVNRSGTMCCAYIMSEHKLNLLDAAKKMKKARGTTLTNRGFQKQLLRFARQKGFL